MSQHIDTQWLSAVAGDDKALMGDLCALYAEQCQELFPLLEQVMRGELPEALVRHVHKMKGSSSSMGMMGIAQEMASMEDDLRAGIADPAAYAQRSVTLREHLDEVLAELQPYIQHQS